ncbi:MAG TPA: response regulator [Acidobacteriaceae bacterium]|nr:response regulator [Acidobacteriaceae bacterium]
MQFALTGKATGATTILVVDDDEDFREVIAAILEKAGYDVLEAPNGAEAAAILDRRPGAVDLLITDIQMPKMTGAQLIECVLRLHPLTRVLCVSGEPPDAALPASTPFLRKPFDRKSLLSKVKEILVEEKIVRAQNVATA